MLQIRWRALEILERCVHFERFGELLGTQVANAIPFEAAMESGVRLLSVAADDFWPKYGCGRG